MPRAKWWIAFGMKRLPWHILTMMLVLSLSLGAGFTGLKLTSHALAQVGLTEFVICASDSDSGVSTVVVDRTGAEVDPDATDGCAHCADCSLVSLAALLPLPQVPSDALRGEIHFNAMTPIAPRAARVWHPSRGPPMQSKV